jgi:hypothetical protein
VMPCVLSGCPRNKAFIRGRRSRLQRADGTFGLVGSNAEVSL